MNRILEKQLLSGSFNDTPLFHDRHVIGHLSDHAKIVSD